MKRAAFLSAATAAIAARPILAATPASSAVRTIAHGLPGRLGVFARTMADGPPIVAYESSDHFPTASVIKVLIMTTAYAMEEASPGALSAKVTFHNDELIGGSEFMARAQDGERFTVRRLIVPMIQLSDNTAANLLIAHFGFERINGVGLRAGMIRTRLARRFLDYGAIVRHNENVSTPADMGRLLYLIERGAREGIPTIVSARHCRAMVGIMLGQTDRDGIPAALPRGTAVANKTGQIEGTLNDVAIVDPYGDSPFILVVMTAEAYDDAAAYEAIHAVTRATYRAAAGSLA